jgi:CubicO group peptidase (beta-lactamase class C family)
MRRFLYVLLLVFSLNLIVGSAFGVAVYPTSNWQTRTPAQAGLVKSKLDEFRQVTGNRTGVIIKDGYLIYSWGSIAAKVDWASAAKPVISTMLFYAIKELKLSSVNALVADLGWDLIEKDKTMTFHHLANMRSGYALPERPGVAWGYNDYAILLYNKSLFDRVFKQKPDVVVRAASRLGVLQFQDGALYGTARRGYGLVTSPRDFARIGLFWLNKGNWRGTQRLPASYFDTYMKPQVPANLPRTAGGTNDYLGIGTVGGGTNQDFPGQGTYGYNWWFNSNRVIWPDAPADTIQARGHNNSESMFIIPSRKLVVAFKGKNSTSANAFADANRYLKILMQAFGPGA